MRSLTIYTGPMFSSKSTSLLRVCGIHSEGGNVLCLRPNIDVRSGAFIKTHVGGSVAARNIEEVDVLPHDGVVCVDEAHFCMQQLLKLLRDAIAAGSSVDVYVALLSGTATQTGWGTDAADLLALADKIIQLHATCSVCTGPAPFTVRTDGGVGRVDIGGAEKYAPRCRKHLTTRT